jgi:DNA excision repair protein ERCC-3
LPEANVIIQISSHYGSRRQEAQRLGRILRPKAKSTDEFNAFFYSLVSKDTEEMYYSTKRQQFLIDQGYAFKVLTELPQHDDTSLLFSTKSEQLDMLATVLAADEKAAADEDLPSDYDQITINQEANRVAARRHTGSAKSLSGADGMVYMEYRTTQKTVSSSSAFNRPSVKHPLFKGRSKK